jgi:hypothetical protein
VSSSDLPGRGRGRAASSDLTGELSGLRGTPPDETPTAQWPPGTSGSLGGPPPKVKTKPAPAAVRTGGPRRARLTIRRVDPWSVLKFTLLFSLCMLVVGVVAVAALYYALDRLEVFESINKQLKLLTEEGSGATATGGLEIYFRGKTIIGGAAILGLLNTIIMTALATLFAFIYNLVADIVGGIEVVLGEHD